MSTFNICFLVCLFLFQKTDNLNVYEVRKAKKEIDITGKGIDAAWAQATLLTDFQLPWNDEIPQPTSFQALWTDSALYLLYQVIDHNVVAPGPAKDERGVLPSDRVEIFFKVRGAMNPYYCLELDPRARVLDYQARYYRQTDFDWSWPENHLEVQASVTADGYIVEVRITLESLRDLAIVNGDNTIDAGLFRGDFQRLNETTHVKWISWIDPGSANPDFHIPAPFGKLILTEEDKTP